MTRAAEGGTRGRRRGPLLLAAACAGLLALVGAAVAAAASADVVERGALLPWAGDGVRRIRLAGLEVFLSSEFDPQPDAVTTWVLVAAGSVAAFSALLVWARAPAPTLAFFVLSAAGAWFLALDEGFAVHESIGHNLGFLADLPGVRRPDDVVFGLYALVAIAFVAAYRRLLARTPGAVALYATALAMVVVVSLLDFTDLLPDKAEEGLEIVAAAVVLGGYLASARALVLEASAA